MQLELSDSTDSDQASESKAKRRRVSSVWHASPNFVYALISLVVGRLSLQGADAERAVML